MNIVLNTNISKYYRYSNVECYATYLIMMTTALLIINMSRDLN